MTCTPSFTRVRDLYSWAIRWDAGDHEDRPDLARLQVDQRAEFDRAMAEHDEQVAARALRDRELHHFEAEKALTDLLALSWAITRDSHCSHLGADIRALLPADVLTPDHTERDRA